MTLQYVGGATAEIVVTKDGRKYMYFTTKERFCKYRVNKETGEVQVAPYWYTVKGMSVIK